MKLVLKEGRDYRDPKRESAKVVFEEDENIEADAAYIRGVIFGMLKDSGFTVLGKGFDRVYNYAKALSCDKEL